MYTYTDFLIRVRGQFIFVKTYYPSISQYEILTYFNIIIELQRKSYPYLIFLAFLGSQNPSQIDFSCDVV